MPNLLLTESQRREFDDNGFLIFEELLAPHQIDQYLAVINALDNRIGHSYGDKPRQPGEHLELRNAVAHDPSLLELLTHDLLFPAIVDLMGYNICMTTSHVFIRTPSPAGTPRDFKAIGWHRDGPPHEWTPAMNGRWPWLYTKIGWFFTDTTIPDAGALRIVPGSHKVLRPAWKPGAPDPYGAVEVRLKPGSAVIFENRLWHAVGPNYSDVARKNIYFGYCWRWMRPIDYVQTSEALMQQATPVQQQLLGKVTSGLGYILPQEEDVPLKTWVDQRQPPTIPSGTDATPVMI